MSRVCDCNNSLALFSSKAGPKKSLLWYKTYLVIVSSEQKASAASKKDLLPRRAVPSDAHQLCTLTVYDVKTKLIAFSGSFNDVQHVLAEFGSLFVIQGDGKVALPSHAALLVTHEQIFKLVEKDFHSKLETLFKKGLYEVAQLLAQNQRSESAAEAEENLLEIYTQWACLCLHSVILTFYA